MITLADSDPASNSALTLSAAEFEAEPDLPNGEEYWMTCTAALVSSGGTIEARLTMIDPYRRDTLAFFEQLAAKPDEWRGRASWSSEYNDLQLEFSAMGDGRIFVRARIAGTQEREAHLPRELTVSHSELRRFMTSLRQFLRVSRGEALGFGRWSTVD